MRQEKVFSFYFIVPNLCLVLLNMQLSSCLQMNCSLFFHFQIINLKYSVFAALVIAIDLT